MEKIRYLVEYFFYKIIIFILGFFKFNISSKIMGYIAKKIGPIVKNGEYVRFNLKYIFPQKTKEELKYLEEKIWENFGRYIGEYAHVFNMDYDEILKLTTIENLDFLEKFKNEKIIIVSAHLANWDIGLRVIAEELGNISAIYRKMNNQYIDEHLKSQRKLCNITLIEKGVKGSKTLMKTIKNSGSIIVLNDQKFDEGLKIPFMGKYAMTASAIAYIARKYDYKIMPARVIREKNNARFKIVFYDPFLIDNSENESKDIEDAITRINNIYSDWIQENPEDWFWMHQRWGKISILKKEEENVE